MVSHALHLHGGQPGQGHSPPRRGGSTPALMCRSNLFQRENGMGWELYPLPQSKTFGRPPGFSGK